MKEKLDCECLIVGVPIVLEKNGSGWLCETDCVYRPGGRGGEVKVNLGEGPTFWGERRVVFGVRKCRRVEG